MLTREQNERLTRVGPGTPMGELMRRYWQPIAALAQLDEAPVLRVRLLGEDLVLFRDTRGKLGLVGDRCAHRLVELELGYPVENGLRCPYHGWTYDATGQCVEQPAEPAGSPFCQKIRIKAYPVQELAGLVFAYAGPTPAPLLPRWQPLVLPNTLRQISLAEVPVNWLQCAENSPDQTHNEWLHGHFAKWALERRGYASDSPPLQNTIPRLRHHVEQVEERYQYGILRRRLLEGMTKEHEAWSVGQPILMPNMNSTSGDGEIGFMWRVPADDTHTTEWAIRAYHPADGVEVPRQDTIPYYRMPLKDEQGRWNTHVFNNQDHMAFVAQGEIMDRTQERLGESDRGIILYRQMLLEQLDIVEAGGEPMNVFRDPAGNECIDLPLIRKGYRFRTEDGQYRPGAVLHGISGQYSPIAKQLEEIAQQSIASEAGKVS
jgi:5,5'-dehydrodivanillate O-demethylase